jgi:hypothetical protein
MDRSNFNETTELIKKIIMKIISHEETNYNDFTVQEVDSIQPEYFDLIELDVNLIKTENINLIKEDVNLIKEKVVELVKPEEVVRIKPIEIESVKPYIFKNTHSIREYSKDYDNIKQKMKLRMLNDIYENINNLHHKLKHNIRY